MGSEKYLGRIKIIDIVDNGDNTNSLTYEVPDELKEEIVRSLGWEHWSSEKFNKIFLEALVNNAKNLERELGVAAPDDQRCVDVFDNRFI